MLEHFFKEEGVLSETKILEIQQKIHEEVEDAVTFAEESPWPEASGLYTDNYVEDDYPYMKD